MDVVEPQCAALAAALADAGDFSAAERAHRACLAALLSQVRFRALVSFLVCWRTVPWCCGSSQAATFMLFKQGLD